MADENGVLLGTGEATHIVWTQIPGKDMTMFRRLYNITPIEVLTIAQDTLLDFHTKEGLDVRVFIEPLT